MVQFLAQLLITAAGHAGQPATVWAAPKPPGEGRGAPDSLLRVGIPGTFRVAPGDTLRLRFAARRGEFVKGMVEELRGDVQLSVAGPDGKVLDRHDHSESLGDQPELIAFIARDNGEFALVLTTSPGRPIVANARVLLEAVRHPTVADTGWVRAHRLLDAGVHLADVASTASDSMKAATDSLRLSADTWGALGEKRWRGAVLFHMSRLAEDVEDHVRALSLAAEARGLFEEVGHRRGVARVFQREGFIDSQTGDPAAALESFERALAIARETDDPYTQASVLGNIGFIRAGRGEHTVAAALYREAIALHRQTGSAGGLRSTQINLANEQSATGQYQEALTTYTEVLAGAQAAGDDSQQAIALNNMGGLLLDLGRPREAVDYRLRSLEIFRRMKDRRGQATLLTNIASMVPDTEPDRARALYEEALTLRREVGDRAGEAATAYNLGNLLNRQREYDDATRYLRISEAMLDSLGDRRNRAIVLGTLGKVRANLGDLRGAVAALERSLALSRETGDRRSAAITLNLLAQDHRALGELDLARAAVDESLEITEVLRRSIEGQGLRTSFTANFRDGYGLLIDVLMDLQQKRPTERTDIVALGVAERARSRSLLDGLGDVRDSLARSTPPALAAELTTLQQEIAKAARTPASPQASRRLDSLFLASDALSARIRSTNPRLAHASAALPLDAQQVQRDLLDDTSILLEYHVGGARSVLWAVRRDTIASYLLPGRATIDTLVRSHYRALTARADALGNGSVSDWRARLRAADVTMAERGRRLTDLLLGPAAGLLPGKRLLIAATGPIQFVAFAALPPPLRHEVGAAPFLADLHEIVVLPSASSAALLRRRASQHGTAAATIAVFADPVFSATDPRVPMGNAPKLAPADTVASVAAVARRSGATDQSDNLGRLPWTSAEAATLRRLVPPSRRRERVGLDATVEAALDPVLGSYRVVHFATHALLDDVRPDLSGIVLSLVDSAGRPRDGFLRIHQVYGMDLPVELVVLSACQTALGAEIHGEGLVGLARAFLFAGASRVVASLWKVDDRATAVFMSHFYSAMFGPARPTAAVALRAAQRRMARDPRYNAPYFWAGFVVMGDWR